MYRSRKLLLPLLALCAVVAFAPATASAATAHPAYKHKKQDRLLKKHTRSIKKANRAIKALGTTVAALTTDTKSNSDTLKTIVAGVPDIVNGLTALKDGLTTLATAYKAVEYGVYHTVISVGGTNVADMPNQFSADIPDDGNGAQVSSSIPFTAPASAPTAVNVRAAIRSAEGDGTGASDPVGEVGGLIYVTCNSIGGCDPDGGGPAPASVAEGAIMCVPGQTPAGFQYKNPSSGNTSTLTLVPIPLKTERTDQSRPTDDPTDATTVNATGGSRCQFSAVAGKTYIVHTAFQFFDLPTSTSPGPAD